MRSCRTAAAAARRRRWQIRYARRHQPVRIKRFPKGVAAPVKVRIYRRCEYHQLQWWEPSARQTITLRVDDDLVGSLAKAREIDQRLLHFRRSGHCGYQLTHAQLLQRYLEYLRGRADDGMIATSTVRRYSEALAHYHRFLTVAIAQDCEKACRADSALVRQFQSWLHRRQVSPNGRENCHGRQPMASSEMAMGVVRSMYAWGADVNRGNLLPSGFANPFANTHMHVRRPPRNPVGEPDITLAMAVDFLGACDWHQLRLFVPMVFWGLRPGEVGWLFHEHVSDRFLEVKCIQRLAFMTKGVRDKSLPMLPALRSLLGAGQGHGLILCRRPVEEGRGKPPLLGLSLTELYRAFEHRVQLTGDNTSASREEVRNMLMHDAGALTYGWIRGEYARLAAKLRWPDCATLKDLRHLCQTSLENGGMTLGERQYLLGHSQGQAAINSYTHYNKLDDHYQRAVEREMQPLLEVVEQRCWQHRKQAA